MNKRILILVVFLSFYNVGLSITYQEARRFGLSELLDEPDIRIYLNQSCDAMRLILPRVASAMYNHCLAEQTAHANTVSEIKKLQTALTANQTSIDASNKQNAVWLESLEQQLKGLEERLDQFVDQLQTAFNASNKQKAAQMKGLEP